MLIIFIRSRGQSEFVIGRKERGLRLGTAVFRDNRMQTIFHGSGGNILRFEGGQLLKNLHQIIKSTIHIIFVFPRTVIIVTAFGTVFATQDIIRYIVDFFFEICVIFFFQLLNGRVYFNDRINIKLIGLGFAFANGSFIRRRIAQKQVVNRPLDFNRICRIGQLGRSKHSGTFQGRFLLWIYDGRIIVFIFIIFGFERFQVFLCGQNKSRIQAGQFGNGIVRRITGIGNGVMRRSTRPDERKKSICRPR